MALLTPDRGDALTAEASAWLRCLAGQPWTESFYLAGSAALALYLGHRRVGNLDLMSASARLASPERRDLLATLKRLDPRFEVETAQDGYLYGRGHDGVALKLFHYPYPLIAPAQAHDGVDVASAADLGAMKLAALIARAARRDFVDLYLLCRRLPLAALIEHGAAKFSHVRDFSVQALKALADRELAREDPMPELLEPLAWDEVERWADRALRDEARARFQIPETT
ncbi:MAG: nucleotidyl transferase AbiEii/AbiGii toxin family protein [Thermoanaerobaculia bacterium]